MATAKTILYGMLKPDCVSCAACAPFWGVAKSFSGVGTPSPTASFPPWLLSLKRVGQNLTAMLGLRPEGRRAKDLVGFRLAITCDT